MRLVTLVFTALLAAAPGWAQPSDPSSAAGTPSPSQDGAKPTNLNLPVSLDKIKEALEQPPAEPLRGLDEIPHFKLEVQERRKISLEDLINGLDFKTGPAPGGGLYGYEQQRQVFPSVDNPLRQPYAAFNQPELLTVLVENLVGRYLAGRAASSITAADRARAETAARDEVQQAVRDYCAAQPSNGAGIQICSNSIQ